MVCLKYFDKAVGRGVTMVVMLHGFLQGDSDTGADPQNPIYTSEVEVVRDEPSEVGKNDGIERNESVVT